jgi:hypothetical protein
LRLLSVFLFSSLARAKEESRRDQIPKRDHERTRRCAKLFFELPALHGTLERHSTSRRERVGVDTDARVRFQPDVDALADAEARDRFMRGALV